MALGYEKARQVKQRFESVLLNKENVVGVGIGLRQVDGVLTDEVALIVMVKKKVEEDELTPEEMVPTELEGVIVDVQEVGEVRAGV